jgi:hypothetical protein
MHGDLPPRSQEHMSADLSTPQSVPGRFQAIGAGAVHRQVFLEELERLGRGQPLAEDDPDRVVAGAMGDARARRAALLVQASNRHDTVGTGA